MGTHRIHGTSICIPTCTIKSTKCRQIYHTWIFLQICIPWDENHHHGPPFGRRSFSCSRHVKQIQRNVVLKNPVLNQPLSKSPWKLGTLFRKILFTKFPANIHGTFTWYLYAPAMPAFPAALREQCMVLLSPDHKAVLPRMGGLWAT